MHRTLLTVKYIPKRGSKQLANNNLAVTPLWMTSHLFFLIRIVIDLNSMREFKYYRKTSIVFIICELGSK